MILSEVNCLRIRSPCHEISDIPDFLIFERWKVFCGRSYAAQEYLHVQYFFVRPQILHSLLFIKEFDEMHLKKGMRYEVGEI